MTHTEILTALKAGKKVYWGNSSYSVILDINSHTCLALYRADNEYYSSLDYDEFEDCFIG